MTMITTTARSTREICVSPTLSASIERVDHAADGIALGGNRVLDAFRRRDGSSE